jgi:hypothetical protein
VVAALKLSRATYRKMVHNLLWATGYNIMALSLAAGVADAWGVLIVSRGRPDLDERLDGHRGSERYAAAPTAAKLIRQDKRTLPTINHRCRARTKKH